MNQQQIDKQIEAIKKMTADLIASGADPREFLKEIEEHCANKTKTMNPQTQPIRVRIDKCGSPYWWYSDKIGETFEVIDKDVENYLVIGEPWLIGKSDCTIIQEPATPPGIPPGIIAFKNKIGNIVKCKHEYGEPYDIWVAVMKSLEAEIHTIRDSKGVEWSVGEKVHSNVFNNDLTINEFMWLERKNEWNVIYDSGNARVFLSSLTKLPPSKEQEPLTYPDWLPPMPMVDKDALLIKELRDRIFELEERLTANAVDREIYLETLRENSALQNQNKLLRHHAKAMMTAVDNHQNPHP